MQSVIQDGERSPVALPRRRAVLVVAHPGHELRVHGWLEQSRPVACVLTDGSGHGLRPRLASTAALLARAVARPGPVFGRMTDRAIYMAMLAGDAGPFAALAEELANLLVAERADYVVADALEGYNPSHDICRVLVEAAVAIAARRDRRVESFDFPLIGAPDACPAEQRGGALRVTLDDGAFRRKLAAAQRYQELASEVTAALGSEPTDAFRRETLRPVPAEAARGAPPEDPPYYERYGERQVAAGRYATVLRWRTHLAPLVRGIRTRLGLEG